MKKLLALSLLLIICAFAICSCAGTPDTSSANKITYGEKYYRASDYEADDEEKFPYFVIYEDGYLDYVASKKTTRYKYEIVDESTLAYFFYSSTDLGEDTASNGVLVFSENVLMTKGGAVFVREGYINEELPNFGKYK